MGETRDPNGVSPEDAGGARPGGDVGPEAPPPPPPPAGEPARSDPAAPATAVGKEPPEAAERRPARAPLAHEVHDRMTVFVVRSLFFLIAGGIGLYCSRIFGTETTVSILISLGIAVTVILAEVFFSKAPVRTISAITFGLIMGLIMSAVFQPVIELMVQSLSGLPPGSRDSALILDFLRLVSTTLFCYFGVTVLLGTKDDFKFIIPYVEFRREVKGRAPLILDTSAIIDGRIQAFLATGVLDQRLAVPKFVFDELQGIADSPDRGRRERGRRGMDILEALCREHGAEILDRPAPTGMEVDVALLDLVTSMGGRLVTTDYNLQKRAKLQEITVINLNDLAAALKPALVPGEAVRVRLQREGEEFGQAVGFLPDGTMVVVENANRRIGQEVSVEVTSAIQTGVGKMIFGRLRRLPGSRMPEDRPPRMPPAYGRGPQEPGRPGGPPRGFPGGPRPYQPREPGGPHRMGPPPPQDAPPPNR